MWGAIKKAINSNLNKSLDVLIQEKTTELGAHVTGNASTTNNHVSACRDQIQANIQTLSNGRVVKSVQRGVIRYTPGNNTYSAPISAIEMSKSLLIISPQARPNASNYTSPAISGGQLLSSSQIEVWIQPNTTNQIFDIAWQIVEFH